jgi:Tol biopolymer transport system component
LQISPAISPDNKKIGFVWNGSGDQFDIYSKSGGSAELQQLTHAPRSDAPGSRLPYHLKGVVAF